MRKTTITHLLKLALVILGASLIATPSRPSALAGGRPVHADDPEASLVIKLWPGGVVPYKFDDGTYGPVAVDGDDPGDPDDDIDNDIANIERQMARWEQALTITDPGTGQSRQYIDFRPCGNNCQGKYLVIRYNRLDSNGVESECNNMSDPVGLEDCGAGVKSCSLDGVTELHFRRGTCPAEATEKYPAVRIEADTGTNQDCNTILHELGHALGLWHEFNRVDADAYLNEQPIDLDGKAFSHQDAFFTKPIQLMPVLGNYDYDSVMAYGGHEDLHEYPFSRKCAEKKCQDLNPGDKCEVWATDYGISPGLKSRMLQYYANEHQPNWGFFQSLSAPPPPVVGNNDTDRTTRRDPYLARPVAPNPRVSPVGTPAIAIQSIGNYDFFVRGSDNCLYWKWERNNLVAAQWENVGCGFGSDPAAISQGGEQIDLFAVDTSGKLKRKRYQNGVWGEPVSVQGGSPILGIKTTADGGYLGPAVASRGSSSFDVFVVRSDGRLSVATLSGNQWTGWTSLGLDYNVTARPAAVALSSTRVQLAINENNVNLYEPVLTFPPATPTFTLGALKGKTASKSPPALTKRSDPNAPYRVLIVNADGRISHRFSNGSWRDIGGQSKPGTGPSAVATGPSSAYIVMNGVDLIGCDSSCGDYLNNRCDLDYEDANGNRIIIKPGAFIEPGGLWVRNFK